MIAPNDPRDALDNVRSAEFRVRLEDVFAGPLDLLLHLVKEQEVEITHVSLARVCNDFLRYVRDLAEVDLGRTGDYLVVAATLVAIKSRALLPTAEPVDLDDDLDPGDDLVKRLLQYRRVREASRDLAERSSRRDLLYGRGTHDMPSLEPGEIDLGEIGAWDLLSAFATILREVGPDPRTHRIRRPDRSLRDFVVDIAAALRRDRRVNFRALFTAASDREWVIGTFLAILELAKQGAVAVEQAELFGEIDIARAFEDVEAFDRAVAGIDIGEEGATFAAPADGAGVPTAEVPSVGGGAAANAALA
jgi:segregation and condensation protein A